MIFSKFDISKTEIALTTKHCIRCNSPVPKVENSKRVICWFCVAKDQGKFWEERKPQVVKERKNPPGYPLGWRWMKQFVDKEGNVYLKGVIAPELKGKFAPTEIKPPKPRKVRRDAKEAKLIKRYQRKMRNKNSNSRKR